MYGAHQDDVLEDSVSEVSAFRSDYPKASQNMAYKGISKLRIWDFYYRFGSTVSINVLLATQHHLVFRVESRELCLVGYIACKYTSLCPFIIRETISGELLPFVPAPAFPSNASTSRENSNNCARLMSHGWA